MTVLSNAALQTPPERGAAVARALRIVADPDADAALRRELFSRSGPVSIAFVNAHAFNMAWESEEVAALFLSADVLLRDGKGLEILVKRLGRAPGLNMNGTDLIPQLLAAAQDMPIAVLGTAEPWLLAACDRLEREGRRIVARLDGFRPEEAYEAIVAETEPRVVLLAMGMPRQERVAKRLRAAFPDRDMLIICGGAIVDFLAERFNRAPAPVRAVGMEWAWRLMLEPRRLFRRYVIGNALFLHRTGKLARRSPSDA
jgi:N-acetylglucosaminyldiphosphoundecaprenol N-acetyl-beta-D-mannosaminyltransferase